jgi:hypothetical protein
MTKKNHRVIAIEAGVPGTPKIGHLAIHAACDRFLTKHKLHNPGFRHNK